MSYQALPGFVNDPPGSVTLTSSRRAVIHRPVNKSIRSYLWNVDDSAFKLIEILFLFPDPNNSTSSQVKETKNDKPMHNTNAKLVRALTNNLTESRPSGAEVNRGNIIFVRGAKTSDGGHILLRTDSLQTSKTSLVLDEGDHGKLGQIFIQQSDIAEGVLLQSVKRLGGGTPIFLLSGNDNGNGHFLIQTTSAEDVHSVADIGEEQGGDNILLQALEGLHDNETSSTRGISTPIGSGKALRKDDSRLEESISKR
ncbi:hypothetical protein GEV33_011378 [Tenebrio molitor]|uniref:Uncharacterized protein n=1 Tax=Tenebrio molitor TaxID=7067 RepID=A0A8J6HCZ9_TENMO|nr:hypothetical protein GEV33_011378 [Tenebrio molitor]